MKKTIRTLSMVMMTLAMALCFLFAGLAFVKTDVLAEVDQSAIDTAAVYIGKLGEDFNVNETGIKFTAKIKKTDYYALTGGTDAKGNTEVHLGVEVARANANGTYTTLPNAHFIVDTAGTLNTYNVGGVELEDYFMYSFTIKYNLENIFGANFDATNPTIAKNINFMYRDELCIRPFYQVISELDGASEPVYGEYGASRSMLHVATAEWGDENSTLSADDKNTFITKYASSVEEVAGEIEVYADGRTNVALDSAIETYTVGTSGKVVARGNGAIDPSSLEGYAVDEYFKLFGYTADRKVFVYNAKFKGFTGISTTPVEEEFVLDESGKLYLNNTQFANATIESLFYRDGNFLENATITEEVGNKIGDDGLVARIGGVYYNLKNVLYVTKAFENSRESRLEFVDLFSGYNRSNTVHNGYGERKTLDGYYILLDNITFDISNIPVGEENKMAAEDFDLTGLNNEFFSNSQGGNEANTFKGVFDGRGYALNNVRILGYSSSMFGVASDGATIKNVAFNGFTNYVRRWIPAQNENGDLLDANGDVLYTKGFMDDGTTVVYSNLNGERQLKSGNPRAATDLSGVAAAYYYYDESGSETGSKIFYRTDSKTSSVTFENIYVNDPSTIDNRTYGSLFFYDYAKDCASDEYLLGKLTIKQVLVINKRGCVLSGSKGMSGFSSDDTVEDFYIINTSNKGYSSIIRASASSGNGYVEDFDMGEGNEVWNYTDSAITNFAKAYTEGKYDAFPELCWSNVDGMLVWNSLNVFVTLKDGETAVTAIESNEAGKEYKLETVAYNKPGDVSKITVSGAENLVDYANGKITVKQFASGEATLTVSYDGVVIATYNVNVETMPVITLTDKNDNVITEINSIDKNDVFTVTATAGGKEVAVTLEKEDANNLINISGNVVIVNEKVVGSAILTVKIGDTVFATYNVIVDTIPLEEIGAEVLLSAKDGRLYFNGIEGYEGTIAKEVYYGDELISTIQVIDTTEIAVIDTTKIMATDDIRAAAQSMVGEGEDKKPGNQVTLKVVTSTGAKYLLTDVKLYTAVFEDEHTSRLAMRDMFSYYGRVRANSSGAVKETNLGYYVLAENINFDLSNLPMTAEDAAVTDNPELLSQSAWYKQAPYELFGNPNNGGSIFGGTLDGRGFSLNNIGLFGNMFGIARDGAVVKNIAFNGITVYSATSVPDTNDLKKYFNISNIGTNSKLFSIAETNTASITFENVFVADTATGDSSFSSVFFYNRPNNGTDNSVHGNLTFRNVIVENVGGPIVSGYADFFNTVNDTDTVENAYVIGGGYVSRDNPSVIPNSRGENFVKYASYDAMREATNNNYSDFLSQYWTIYNGIPVWNTCSTIVTMANAPTEVVTEAGKTYTVNAIINGVVDNKNLKLELDAESDAVVSVAGNVITVLDNVAGTATIQVKIGEEVIATYTIEVNTKPVVTLTGPNGAVDSIDSILSDEEYTITAMQGGNDVSNQIEIEEIENGVVFVKDGTNNVLVVGTNVSGNATVIVKFAGVEIARYEVSVNTRAVVTLKDKEQNEITAINSVDKNDTFTVTAIAGGKEVAVTLDKVDENNVINISGNVVTINEKVIGTATLIVKIGEEEIASYNVTVDTVPFEEMGEEVLLSALDGKLYFNGIDGFEGTIIADALYNDVSIFTEGKIDTTKIMATADIREAVTTDVDEDPENVRYANQVTLKVLTNNSNRYELTNVKLYSGVFDNSYESKVLMSKTFGQCREGSKKVAVLEGYYVLAENITFYDENDTTTDYATMLFGGNSEQSGVQVFDAVFDGRGYTLNNIIMDHNGTNYGIFGDESGPNAVLKNFALIGVRFYSTSAGVSATPIASYKSLFFGSPSVATRDATNKSEISNVYVNIKCGIKLFYNPQSTATYDDSGARDTFGFKTWSNVIVIMEEGTNLNSTQSVYLHSQNGNHSIALEKEAGLVLDDVYFVINGYAWGGKAGNVAYNTAITGYDGLYRYRNVTKMKEDTKNDYSDFDSKYWTIVDGIPAWNTCSTMVTFTGSEGNVTEINSTTAGETYNITVKENGKVVTEGLTYTLEGNAVATAENGVITIASNIKGNATLTVSLNDVAIATIVINVDTRETTNVDAEVLLSKATGKLWYNGAFYDNNIDVASIKTPANTKFELNDVVLSDDNKYNFTNVKLYDGVYAQENKTEFVDLLNDFTGTLEGYYVLASNITFDPASADDRFIPPASVPANCKMFNGTFDGRGYTLNNLSMNNGYGIFGMPGKNAVLKNFAINRIFTASSTSTRAYEVGSSYHAVLVSGRGSSTGGYNPTENILTVENVYIYRYFAFGNRYDNIFGYNQPGAINFKNVFVEFDQDMSLDNTQADRGAVIVAKSWANITATNSYFLNGCGYGNYTLEYEGLTSINNYNDLETRRTELLAKEGVDFSTFSSDYWTVEAGKVPTWKTISTDYVEVSTEEQLVNALANGGSIRLTNDITISNTLNITKDATIYGYGKTITYTGANYAIEVKEENAGLNFIINGVNIDSSNGCESLINYNANGMLALYSVTLDGANVNNTLNLASSSDGAEVRLTNAVITGVTPITISSDNLKLIMASSSEITTLGNATNAISIIGNSVSVTISGSTVSTGDNGANAVSIMGDSVSVSISGSSTVSATANGANAISIIGDSATVTVDGSTVSSAINSANAISITGDNATVTVKGKAKVTSVFEENADAQSNAAIAIKSDEVNVITKCTIKITEATISGTLADGTANVAIYNTVAGATISTTAKSTITGEIVNTNA